MNKSKLGTIALISLILASLIYFKIEATNASPDSSFGAWNRCETTAAWSLSGFDGYKLTTAMEGSYATWFNCTTGDGTGYSWANEASGNFSLLNYSSSYPYLGFWFRCESFVTGGVSIGWKNSSNYRVILDIFESSGDLKALGWVYGDQGEYESAQITLTTGDSYFFEIYMDGEAYPDDDYTYRYNGSSWFSTSGKDSRRTSNYRFYWVQYDDIIISLDLIRTATEWNFPPTAITDDTQMMDNVETNAQSGIWTNVAGDPPYQPYVATSTAAYVNSGTYGYKSEDGGDSWGYYIYDVDSSGLLTRAFTFMYKIVPNPDSPPAGSSEVDFFYITVKKGTTFEGYTLSVVTGSGIVWFRLFDTESSYSESNFSLEINTWYNVTIAIQLSPSYCNALWWCNGISQNGMNNSDWIGFRFHEVMMFGAQWTFGMDCRTAMDNFAQGSQLIGASATIDEMDILNLECEEADGRGWMFAETKYYHFWANLTVPIGSYIDCIGWRFTDASGQVITVWAHNNSGTIEVISATDLTVIADNGTMSYIGASTKFNATISVWLKRTVIDTWDIDLYGYINTTDGSVTNWAIKKSDFCNVYSRGGLEKMSVSSSYAGRLDGGEYFNLFAKNFSYATSYIYWKYLVHIKMLLTLHWKNFQTSIPTWEIGYTYYAKGEWINGMKVTLALIQWSDTASDKWCKLGIAIYNNDILVHNDEMYSFCEKWNAAGTESETTVWLDFWWNKANASSIAGFRATSQFYGMDNYDWWKFITGGTWGLHFKNQTNFIAFATTVTSENEVIHSTEVLLAKIWAKLTYPTDPNQGTAEIQISKINTFDYTFSADMQGVQTPTFEEPRIPTVAMGGVFGMIGSWISMLINALAPAFAFMWSGLVYILDGAIQAVTGQAGVFSGFIAFVGNAVTTFITWMVLLVTNIASITSSVASTIGWFFTNFFNIIWGIISFIVVNPVFSVFNAIASIFGIAYAWLMGTAYTDASGTVWNYTYLAGFQFAGLQGGIVIFVIVLIAGFFMQIMLCFTTMSLDPILEPITLFQRIIGFMIGIFELIWNLIKNLIQLLVQIAHALRDIAPRPFGL